jgi:hypothetical protein
VYKVLVEKPGRGHSEDQVVDGRIGSEWILRKLVGGGLASCCECGDSLIFH